MATSTGSAGTAAGEGGEGSEDAPRPGRLSPIGWARWAWRILTSMRTALILLFLLAIAAIRGSTLQQRVCNPDEVRAYYGEIQGLTSWLARFYLCDGYSSPWYAAIFLLLFTALIGCVIPRAAAHCRLVRSRPAKT